MVIMLTFLLENFFTKTVLFVCSFQVVKHKSWGRSRLLSRRRWRQRGTSWFWRSFNAETSPTSSRAQTTYQVCVRELSSVCLHGLLSMCVSLIPLSSIAPQIYMSSCMWWMWPLRRGSSRRRPEFADMTESRLSTRPSGSHSTPPDTPYRYNWPDHTEKRDRTFSTSISLLWI